MGLTSSDCVTVDCKLPARRDTDQPFFPPRDHDSRQALGEDRGVRRVLRALPQRDPRHRRRVGLRQDHHRQDRGRPRDPRQRQRQPPRPRLGDPQPGRAARRAQAHPARLPGPAELFDPRYTVERVIGEALGVAGHQGDDRKKRLGRLLDLVSLDDSFRTRRPIELSGGQRQRVAVARALASDPEVIVLDEPVSALDVSVQARILDLLTDLQEQLGVSYLFISHDLGVIHHMCDRVLVMKDGAVVESGDVDEVFRHPAQDYTRALLDAIPRLTPQ
jgi:ABC-type branched-subunit amino acid transport system ATPase component